MACDSSHVFYNVLHVEYFVLYYTEPIIGALDDAAILWLGSNLFVELCPDDVVKEHMQAIDNNLGGSSSDEIVDAEAMDMDDDKK